MWSKQPPPLPYAAPLPYTNPPPYAATGAAAIARGAAAILTGLDATATGAAATATGAAATATGAAATATGAGATATGAAAIATGAAATATGAAATGTGAASTATGAAATATGAASTAAGAASTAAGASATAAGAAATAPFRRQVATLPQHLTCLDGPTHVEAGTHLLLAHLRVLTCPCREHGPQVLHLVHLAGLTGEPQTFFSTAGPTHVFPQAFPGRQVLFLVFIPIPQVAEQRLYLLHFVHFE